MSYLTRKNVFVAKVKEYLASIEYSRRVEKIKLVYELFQVIEDHADIVFDPNNRDFVTFAKTVKLKLLEFERSEPELKEFCQKFLQKHYNDGTTDKERFRSNMNGLIQKCYFALAKEDKIKIIEQILDTMEKYSHILFFDSTFSLLKEIVKKKLIEFSSEDCLKERCETFLTKYYDVKIKPITKVEVKVEKVEVEKVEPKSFVFACEELMSFDQKLTKKRNKIGAYICSNNLLYDELVNG